MNFISSRLEVFCQKQSSGVILQKKVFLKISQNSQ